MNLVLYVLESCEHVEHFRIGRFMAKLPTDRDQTSVFKNEKWQKTNAIIQYKRFRWLFWFSTFMPVLFRDNTQNKDFHWNVITHFGAPSKLFHYLIFFFYLLPKFTIQSLTDEVFLERNISFKLKHENVENIQFRVLI